MTKKWRSSAGILGVIGIVAVFGGGAWSLMSDAYPSDFVKREALARCSANVSGFLRFSSQERDNCYSTLHVPGYAQTLTR